MIVKLINAGVGTVAASGISIRCPACKHVGTFEPAQDLSDLRVNKSGPGTPIYSLGHRICPNRTCRAHLFVVQESQDLVASYPAERLDFDSSSIPEVVVEPLEEAITCHANSCYMASGMLVRKTLEALCEEEGAEGGNLKQQLADFRSRVTLPQSLFDALDNLRLLGNDAAHIENWDFEDVGQQEAELAISLTKEVLKALYQHEDLVNQLRSLKSGGEE